MANFSYTVLYYPPLHYRQMYYMKRLCKSDSPPDVLHIHLTFENHTIKISQERLFTPYAIPYSNISGFVWCRVNLLSARFLWRLAHEI